jgi:catechol 2,3-dioxygenase-like lactoylglutathione lyase family enzyme
MIAGFDHLVLTVADLDATLRFYRGGLGMRHETFGAGRSALHVGDRKINLQRMASHFQYGTHKRLRDHIKALGEHA